MQNKLFEQETGIKPQLRFDGVRKQTLDLLQSKSGFQSHASLGNDLAELSGQINN